MFPLDETEAAERLAREKKDAAAQLAQRQADADRRAADAAKAQAERTKAEADQAARARTGRAPDKK
jgi:hypothetical protein